MITLIPLQKEGENITNYLSNEEITEIEKSLIGDAITERILFLTSVIDNIPKEDTDYIISIHKEIISLYSISARYQLPLYN